MPLRLTESNTEVVMHYMNAWDIERAVDLYESHPVLGPAARTLQNLERWTNENSDGWAYWPKPVRAAKKLFELLEPGMNPRYNAHTSTEEYEAMYKAALRPVKAFRTRQGADFEIEEAL